MAPNVPTYAEQGFPGSTAASWVGFFAPANAQILATLNAAIDDIVKSPEVRKKLADMGFDPITGSPAQADAMFAAEVKKWGGTAKALGSSFSIAARKLDCFLTGVSTLQSRRRLPLEVGRKQTSQIGFATSASDPKRHECLEVLRPIGRADHTCDGRWCHEETSKIGDIVNVLESFENSRAGCIS